MEHAGVRIRMKRETLENVPQIELLDDYSLRFYSPGMQNVWEDIHRDGDRFTNVTSELFRGQFGEDDILISKRQLYLYCGRSAAGTATAWFDSDYKGEEWGRVHWVCLKKGFQGKGLSRILLSAVLLRLRDLGHERAYLVTSSRRRAAVRVYAKFGFCPDIGSPEERKLWQEMSSLLS